MYDIINGFYLETGYGFNPHTSTVTEIKKIDEFSRLVMGAMVYRGEWEDCIKYAKTHENPLNK